MKEFMDNNFLLQSKTAEKLYHEYAADMPIYDYHNHLNPKEIYEDHNFENIAKLWLGGDHYKWRMMRSNGFTEDYITGNKSDIDKFKAFAATLPFAIGNPMYHWSHLELKRYFGVEELLSEETAEEVYNRCNELLKEKEFSVRNLIKRSNVKSLCTTDDPKDDLKYHRLLAKEWGEVKVLPTFRPDKLINIENPSFFSYVESLNELGHDVGSFQKVLRFLESRIDYFHKVGCRLSDHALDTVMFRQASEEEVAKIYEKALLGEGVTADELRGYKGYVLTHLGREYSRRNWVQQYHIGALRNNSTRMFNELGADTGFDSVNDSLVAADLSRLMDSLDSMGELPKTILYCLNPSDNTVLASMMGNFQGGGIAGKIQFGTAWWFLDTKAGMIKQMEDLASLGLLGRFVGMLTDSRSFLSFPRHEYFRRIMCNEVAKLVEAGEFPQDFSLLERIVKGICFDNINNYITE